MQPKCSALTPDEAEEETIRRAGSQLHDMTSASRDPDGLCVWRGDGKGVLIRNEDTDALISLLVRRALRTEYVTSLATALRAHPQLVRDLPQLTELLNLLLRYLPPQEAHEVHRVMAELRVPELELVQSA